jgi:hypothetical protein
MNRHPYSPVDSRRCKKCGKVKKKYRPKPERVNPYDAGTPREYCKCDN